MARQLVAEVGLAHLQVLAPTALIQQATHSPILVLLDTNSSVSTTELCFSGRINSRQLSRIANENLILCN